MLGLPGLSVLKAQGTAVLLSTSAVPAIGQAGVTTVSVIGSGFPVGTIAAANTTVQFELATGGGVVFTTASSVTALTGTTKRITFQLPGSIIVSSPSGYLVSISGTIPPSGSFSSSNKAALTVTPPPAISSIGTTSAQAGQNLQVTIAGQYTNLLQGATTAMFGPGISVGGAAQGAPGPVAVTSSTSATAQIAIDPAAVAGPRNVVLTTGLQQPILASGFTVNAGAPPTISDFNPKSAPIGTSVTLSGTALMSPAGVPADVRLIKLGGGSVSAPITASTSNSLTFVIPSTAATGIITVAGAGGTATSTTALTVIPSSTFTVGAAPTSLALIAGQTATYTVTLSSSNGFNGLAQLGRTGVPNGVTATFSPTQISAGQQSTLTVTAPANQGASNSTIVITASGTVDGLTVSATASPTLSISPITTSFVGRTVVDDTNHASLAGITVKMLGKDGAGGTTGCTGQTVSDASGNFALTNLPQSCTGPQLVGFDGSTATAPPGKYAGVDLVFSLVSNQVVASPVLVHLPRIDNVETFLVQQNSNVDQTHTFTSIPGLSVTVYAGTTFTNADGTQPNPFPLAAIVVPVDRLPDAIPLTTASVNAFIVAFQPANTTASKAVAVYFPNTLNTPPGTNVPLTTLDPTRGRMVPYGTGTVSSDGTTIIPDIDPTTGSAQHRYGIVHFDWHGPAVVPPPTVNPTCASDSPCAGKPVDLASGLEVMTSQDLTLNGNRGSLTITRTYRSLSAQPRAFGIGSSFNYDYRLDTLTPQSAAVVNLEFPNGMRVPFNQQPGGTLVNSTAPPMSGAIMTANPDGTAVLRFKTGAYFSFAPGNFLTGSVLTGIGDPNGNVIKIVRDPATPQQITEIDDPVGRKLTFTWNANNYITSITDPIGRAVQYTYDGAGNLSTFTNVLGGVTIYTYDSQNRLLTVKDPRGVFLAKNTYDANGRVSSQIAPSSGTIQFAYTTTNPLVPTSPIVQTVVTDPLGNVTTYRFNTQGYIISATDATGQTRSINRQAGTNSVLSITGAGTCAVCGDTTSGDVTFTYDASGNVLTRTDALGNTWASTYDSVFNNVTSMTDPVGNVTHRFYDAHGNLTKVTDARGNNTTFTRDATGLVTAAQDTAGNITKFTYDALGNLIAVSNPLNQKTQFSYDGASRLVGQMDPLGRTSSVIYNGGDEALSLVDGNGHTVQFTYDTAGVLQTYTDPNGGKTSLAYDTAGRVSSKTDPLKRVKSYQYDLDDNLTTFANRRGQNATFAYDALNRVTTETYADATVQRTYDSNGRLVRVVDSQAGTFNLTYDSAGRLVKVVGPNGTIAYSRDADGRVTARQVQGQTAVAYTYDANGNVTGISMGGASVARTYDVRNLLTANTRSNSVGGTYAYDAVGRILSITEKSGANTLFSRAFTYDAAGQITANAVDTGLPLSTPSATGAFDAANQITAFGATTYTSDSDGNRLTETGPNGTTRYTWDARGRLQSMSSPGGVTTAFVYDPAGQMIQKRVTSPGQDDTQKYVLDDALNIVSVQQGSLAPVSILDGRGPDDIVATVQGGAPVFPLADQIGSEGAFTDGAGTVVGREFYEPYGAPTTSGTVGMFQFTGRPLINAGLFYYRARFYDSGTGRFLSEDPLGMPASGKSYPYASGNPITVSDPTGRYSWTDAGEDALIAGVGSGLNCDNHAGDIARDAAIGVGGGLLGDVLGERAGIYVGGEVFVAALFAPEEAVAVSAVALGVGAYLGTKFIVNAVIGGVGDVISQRLHGGEYSFTDTVAAAGESGLSGLTDGLGPLAKFAAKFGLGTAYSAGKRLGSGGCGCAK